MNYILKDSLDTILENELTEKAAAEFFCKNAYKYLYVLRDEKVISILNKEDVSSINNGSLQLVSERYIISDELVTDEYAHKVLRTRMHMNRLAVIDSHHKLIGEFSDGSLPDTARNIQKNIMSLRYAQLFSEELKGIFADNHWNSVLVMSDEEVFEAFKKAFPWLKAERSDKYIQTSYDVIFNFIYHNKLMHYFCTDNRIEELSKIIEKAAFSRMIDYLNNSGIEHILLRAPVYDRLNCLSPFEEESLRCSCSQHKLIFSDDYMTQFTDSQKLIKCLRSNGHLESYVEDNGWIFVQSRASNDLFNVNNGRRKTIPEIDNYQNSVHIFGTCLVYGFMSDDSKTICSLLQQKESYDNIRVINHGALLGRNLLNMIIDILSTEFKSGDSVVLIDIFEDYPENELYGIIDTNSIFNEFKPHNETWFLDFPLHCNAKANKLIADTIEQHLAIPAEDSVNTVSHCFLREFGGYKRTIYYVLHKPLTEIERRRIKEITASAGAESRFTDAGTVGVFPEQTFKPDDHCAVVRYGLDYDYHIFPQYHFFIEDVDTLDPGFMKRISDSFRIYDRKVLLYLGKFPERSYDVDGGAQLANQLISSLSHICHLDIAFIRKEKDTYSDPFVRNISYEEYIDPYGNKFSRRMKNLDTNRSAILNGNEYDLVIAGHCSKFFGLENETNIMDKAVIFPMMLTSGYRRSGELVPEEYTKREKMVLSSVSGIITPSIEEFNDIVYDYDVDGYKVKVIPREISPYFISRHRQCCSVRTELVSIGSFKSQKNHIDELKCLKMLVNSGISNIHLTLIGAVHDRDSYDELCGYIRNNELDAYVSLYHNITQKQVAEILENMDICISCSLWETFGRGIFECMTSGLPCVLSNRLEVIKGYAGSENNVFFCCDVSEMADRIRHLISSSEAYSAASSASIRVSRKVSYNMERERLITTLLYKRWKQRTEYMSWNSGEYEIIWQGAYSDCHKFGDRIRKMYKYPAEDKIKAEFFAQKCAYDNGIFTAEPLFISIDRESGKFFMESRYVRCKAVATSQMILNNCLKLISSLQDLPVDQLRPFSYFKDEFADAAKYYTSLSNEDISEDIDNLFRLESNQFIHGDMLLKNLGICGNELYIFDFQNACCGPAEWDRAYLFSEFLPDDSQQYIDEKVKKYVVLVIKIRIGRAIRRNSSYQALLYRLQKWEQFMGEKQ